MALGWTLGGEVHLLVPGETFANALYRQFDRSGRLDSAFANRELLAFDADSLPRRLRRDSADATILSGAGAVPARLALIRFHAPAACTPSQPAVELVYRLRAQDGPHWPRAHASVVGLMDEWHGVVDFTRDSASVHTRDEDRLLLAIAAWWAAAVTRDRTGRDEAVLALPTLDPDREVDAGEVIPLGPTKEGPLSLVAVRARVATATDTALVSGVGAIRGYARWVPVVEWIVGPVRGHLKAGMLQPAAPHAPEPRRYVLRGIVSRPPNGHALLLVDEVVDVNATASRRLVIDVESGALLASQPLALRCRDR